MDASVKDVVRLVTGASDEERIHFPDVVKALSEAGVERYHADLICASKTYYMPGGTFETVPCHPVREPGSAFSADGVEAAIRAIQGQAIGYRAFCDLIAEAGCVGYFVTLVGHRAIYYGRAGECHVERFPGT